MSSGERKNSTDMIELQQMAPENPETFARAPMDTKNMSFRELEEVFHLFWRKSQQYEKLYTEFLEKYVICERDR